MQWNIHIDMLQIMNVRISDFDEIRLILFSHFLVLSVKRFFPVPIIQQKRIACYLERV